VPVEDDEEDEQPYRPAARSSSEDIRGTLLHGSASGRSDPMPSWSYTMRT
jgi:hypothetical protein